MHAHKVPIVNFQSRATMGTAVLLPQDCLPNSKNRPKGRLSEAIFHSDRASQLRRSTPQATELRDLDSTKRNPPTGRVEWTPKSTLLPLFDHGPDPSQKEVEGRKYKARKPTEVRPTKSLAKSAFDVPAFTILQRPKNKAAADELFEKFLVKVKEEKLKNMVNDHSGPSFVSNIKHQSSTHTKLSEMQLPGSKLKKGGFIVKVEELKVVDMIPSVPKPADRVECYKLGEDLNSTKGQCRNASLTAEPISARRSSDLKALSQVASLKAGSEQQKHLKKTGLVESLKSKQLHQYQPESTEPSGLPRLKRATTDPQFVKQLVGGCRSEVVDIPFSEAKLCNGFIKMASMSCPERWAGPSYFSSPAPSSLPLPKFSVPNQKSLCFHSTGEGHTRNIPQSPDFETPSLELSPLQGVALDVASATKSLRRMLKLDLS